MSTSNCGCHACSGGATSLPTANRPGLDAIVYRAGTHGSFLSTMKARLSSAEHRAGLDGLMARGSDDPSIALLDGWATVADVLTFYQERIANESYVRTAIDPTSVSHLANLVGYQPRPGVAASVYLAYTVQAEPAKVLIPAGTRSQSVPGPGEKAQTFETSVDLEARATWNNLQVRKTKPQKIGLAVAPVAADPGPPVVVNDGDEANEDTLYVQGTSTTLKPNDFLLFDFGDEAAVRRIASVTVESEKGRIAFHLVPLASKRAPKRAPKTALASGAIPAFDLFSGLLTSTLKAKPPVPSSVDTETSFNKDHDLLPRILGKVNPDGAAAAYRALSTAEVTRKVAVTVHPLSRVMLFGASAPKARGREDPLKELEWPFPPLPTGSLGARAIGEGALMLPEEHEPTVRAAIEAVDESDVLYLETAYEGIGNGSWLMLETANTPLTTEGRAILNAADVRVVGKADYGLAHRVSRIELEKNGEPYHWHRVQGRPEERTEEDFNAIRRTVVYLPGAPFTLLEVPNPKPIEGDAIPLDAIYDDLEAGRWVIVSGERDDIQAEIPPGGPKAALEGEKDPIKAPGILWSELARVAAVTHSYDPNLDGDRVRSVLQLATTLGNTYKRDTVSINANIVPATHGESRGEVLGSGDATIPNQSFVLRQPPLTYVSAPTPSGVASTLDVTVNGLRWRERTSFFATGPRDRIFITRQDEAGKTKVTFGDGLEGSRLPTAPENVRARYRNGIGKGGNVKAGQITTPTDRPSGVQSVVNPKRASGGADRDSKSLIRQNAPASVRALDRLVSVADYADFARTFAGVAKATAVVLSDGLRELVHVTIAGVDDIPIDDTSDLLRNLRKAMLRFGDPQLNLAIGVREAKFAVVDAKVAVKPDYPWETVKPRIQAALLDTFSFDRRQIGQQLWRSEVLACIHGVPGVRCVRLDVFGAVTETGVTEFESEIFVLPARPDRENKPKPPWEILPAQMAYVTPNIPETIKLEEMKS